MIATPRSPTTSRFSAFACGALIAAGMLAGGHDAVAAANEETLGSFHHTTFLKRDGSPESIGGFAQTADGFLWIAGTKGLTRFDGKSFAAFHPLPGESLPQAQLEDLFPAEGGGLWMANGTTGATLLKDGRLTDFGPAQGYQGIHGHFMRDGKGRVWSYTATALMRFEEGAWKIIFRYTFEQPLIQADFDSDGNLWAVIADRLLVLPHDGKEFVEPVGAPARARRVFTGASGHIYVVASDVVHFYRRSGLALAEDARPLPTQAFNILEGRNGSVWIGNTSRGILYISREDLAAAESGRVAPRFQQLRQATGLTSDYAPYLMEDSEGDVWVGTANGLDRFRRAAFTQIDLPVDIHTVSAVVDPLGHLWVGSEIHPLLAGTPSGELKETGIPRLTLALFVDPHEGSAWAASVKGVWRLSPGSMRLEKSLGPKEVGSAGAIPCMLRDGSGALYVCTSYSGPGHGLLVSDGGAWKEVFDHPVFPETLAIDSQGAVWAGSKDANRLYKLSNGTETLFDGRQGLATGVVRAIYANQGAFWVGGDEGIQYFDGRRFVTLRPDDPESMKPITGLVQDRQGDLWAQTLEGVLRIRAADVRAFQEGRLEAVHPDVFDDGDGIPGVAGLSWTHPSLRMDADGKIWAQTDTGLAWVDPGHLPVQKGHASVYIDGVEAGGRSYSAGDGDISLPSHQQSVRIAFTSPTLGRPENTGFRYRLLGSGASWQDAGDRRDATFTNLAPGTYRFEVVATDKDGTPSSPVAAVGFERLPAYYETWWFRALWLIPVGLILWMAHDMRARALARRLKIRSDEREAVARDIHDTLLQRLHAVLMSLQRLCSDEAIPTSSREALEQVRHETHDAIAEGREQIFALRQEKEFGLALYDRLVAEGRRFQASGDAYFSLEVRGISRALRCGPSIELRDIALEAMRNAFAHSGASKIVVTLNYEDSAFWIVVSDNGIGFSKEDAGKAAHRGHFGLIGMRERASRLKGSIHIESIPEDGTEVHVRIPARSIYVDAKSAAMVPRMTANPAHADLGP